MTGRHHVEIKNREASFKFDVNRNITIVCGNSGTGKTTLYDMVSDHTRLKEKSGVNISCDKDCVALVDLDWKNQLRNTSDSIVFIDEGFAELKTKEFADAIKSTDNYYVIFNRESLHELPYSVEEIYEIKTSGKYHTLNRCFRCNEKHIYSENKRRKVNFNFDSLLTEDSKSGYQFYSAYFKNKDIECFSSKSNSGIFKWLMENKDRKVLVVADGAAFGSEIDRVLKLSPLVDFRLCLPESFEWLILKSGIIKETEIEKILEDPSEHIESSRFFSWENYFEKLLINKTAGTHFQYAKKEINNVYLNDKNSKKIISEIIDDEKNDTT